MYIRLASRAGCTLKHSVVSGCTRPVDNRVWGRNEVEAICIPIRHVGMTGESDQPHRCKQFQKIMLQHIPSRDADRAVWQYGRCPGYTGSDCSVSTVILMVTKSSNYQIPIVRKSNLRISIRSIATSSRRPDSSSRIRERIIPARRPHPRNLKKATWRILTWVALRFDSGNSCWDGCLLIRNEWVHFGLETSSTGVEYSDE